MVSDWQINCLSETFDLLELFAKWISLICASNQPYLLSNLYISTILHFITPELLYSVLALDFHHLLSKYCFSFLGYRLHSINYDFLTTQIDICFNI